MYIQQLGYLKEGRGGGGDGLFQSTMPSPLAFLYWNFFGSRNEMKC